MSGCCADESEPKAELDDGLDWETIGPDGIALPAESKPDIGPTESSGAVSVAPSFLFCLFSQLLLHRRDLTMSQPALPCQLVSANCRFSGLRDSEEMTWLEFPITPP